MEWMFLPLKRYAEFSGRSRRKEYWMWVLFVVITTLVLMFLDSMLGLGGRATSTSTYGPSGVGYGANMHGGVLTSLFSLAILIPAIAVAVRRLHDTNRSGWWILLPIIPYCAAFLFGGAAMMGAASGSSAGMMAGAGLAGIFLLIGFVCAIVLLVFMCLPSTPGENRYGPNPYGEGEGSTVAAE